MKLSNPLKNIFTKFHTQPEVAIITWVVLSFLVFANPYLYRRALSYFKNNTLRGCIFFMGTFVVRYCPFLYNRRIHYLGKTFTNWEGNSYLYEFLFLNQTYEYPIYQYAKEQLHEGDIFIDVGANEGFFPIVLSDFLGTTGRSYAIEANPSNLHLLRKNIVHNQIQNIEVISGAVSNTSGTGTLYDCNTNKMWSSLNKPHPECFSYTRQKINTHTLDELVQGQRVNISRIKIIKIDVEGGELEVLQGATKLLAKSNAHWIIELNLRSYPLHKVLALFPKHQVHYFPQHYELYFQDKTISTQILPVPYTGQSLHHTVNMIFSPK
jgi:FkbM family methyltransferase